MGHAVITFLVFRVIGVDYVANIVEQVNRRIQERGLDRRARFLEANALDLPFTDSSFPLITDIGTLQHIEKKNWSQYQGELTRVLSDDGYYLNVFALKKNETVLWGFSPSRSDNGEFHKFGVHYYFFSAPELHDIFSAHFEIVSQDFESYQSSSDPGDDVVMVFTLMKKKATISCGFLY